MSEGQEPYLKTSGSFPGVLIAPVVSVTMPNRILAINLWWVSHCEITFWVTEN